MGGVGRSEPWIRGGNLQRVSPRAGRCTDEDLEASDGSPNPEVVRGGSSRSVIRTVSSNVGALVRSVSRNTIQDVLAIWNAPTCRTCLACLESFPVKDLWSLRDCPGEHAMCYACAKTYFSGRIMEARVNSLRCPLYGSDGCSAEATEEELQQLVSAEDFTKYQRFKRFADDANLRECPLCLEEVTPEYEDEKPLPEMCCSSGHRFCYYHGNAHPIGPGECEAYQEKEAALEQKAILASGAKQCPGCGLITLKNDGCNHMVCPGCKCGWCWVCGRQLDGNATTGWHYNPANPAGCLQFANIESSGPRDCKLAIARVAALPGTMLGLLAFWAVLPLWFLTCCIGVGISALLVAVFMISWCPVGCTLSILLSPVGLNDEHKMLIMAAPWMACWSSVECVFGAMD